jgi:hypothetical protein
VTTHFFLEYDEKRRLYRVRTIEEGAVVLVDDLGEWMSENVVVHTLTKACGFKLGSLIGNPDDSRWRLTNPAVTLTLPEGDARGERGFVLCRTKPDELPKRPA